MFLHKATGHKQRAVYRYDASWPLYSMNWSVQPDKRHRLAIGSFMENLNNKVQILSLDEKTSEFSTNNILHHTYPTTKILWVPDTIGVFPDLLATSSECLRIWRTGEPGDVKLECLLNSNPSTSVWAPLTSFDWNEVELNLIGTSSIHINNTCTIWSVETSQIIARVNSFDWSVKTYGVPHNSRVYDISFGRAGCGRYLFASGAADGSVRTFDLRELDYSNVIYEDPGRAPIMKVAWNKLDPRYIATFAADDCRVVILDMRFPRRPVANLNYHTACVNGIAWAPHSPYTLCSASDDHLALIWDIGPKPSNSVKPVLSYSTIEREINQIQWGTAHPEFIAICYKKTLEILRV